MTFIPHGFVEVRGPFDADVVAACRARAPSAGRVLIRAALFDFDGLLCETEEAHFTVLQEMYAAHGAVLEFEQYAVSIGTQDAFDPFEYLEALIGRSVDREALGSRAKQRYLSAVAAEPVCAGVVELLDEADRAGIRCAVASSSSRDWVTGHLARLGLLERFDAICAAEDVMSVKPAPDLYLLALARLQVAARDAVVFEDSPNGILAAKAAGLFCVAVPNALTRRMVVSGADLVVGSLADVTFAGLPL